MTLNGHYALYYITCLSFGAHHKNLNADRPILSAAEMTLGRTCLILANTTVFSNHFFVAKVKF